MLHWYKSGFKVWLHVVIYFVCGCAGSDQELSTDAEADSDGPTLMDNIRYSKDADGNRIYNGVVITKSG